MKDIKFKQNRIRERNPLTKIFGGRVNDTRGFLNLKKPYCLGQQ